MLRKIIRSSTAAAALLSCFLFGAVAYYNDSLPDHFVSDNPGSTSFNTRLPVSSDAFCSRENSDVSLKLFGSVPIKQVKEDIVDRPILQVGGNTFGIKLVTDGVMIIDMKNISGICPAKQAGLKVGDVIEQVNGVKVSSNQQLSDIIRSSEGKDCRVKFRRGESVMQCSVVPVLSEGRYCTGMWVRDSSAGIGTVTFTDPKTGAFAGLGHPICDADTHEALALSHGSVCEVDLTGCSKSEKGQPGQLIGEFSGEDCGEITLNCEGGVYGKTDGVVTDRVSYPLGFSHEVREGKAYIYSQLDNKVPKKYEIEIEKISPNGCSHDMIIKVTDKELIERTGGIVQGMSGSPIIQNGKLIGAVTHVFVDDPRGGYAIFAEKMYRYSQEAVMENSKAAG